jgi:hypothetical protein
VNNKTYRDFTLFRRACATICQRISCSSWYSPWYTCHNEPLVSNWLQLWRPSHRGRIFQNDYSPDGNWCELAYHGVAFNSCPYHWFLSGTKFVLLTSLAEPSADATLQKVYDAYADAVMKNPFHTPEMPIRSDGFDSRITALLGSGSS